MTNTIFAERIANREKAPLSDEFVSFIINTAVLNQLHPDHLWLLWNDYRKKCELYDQSCIMSEFVEWYNLKSI